MKIIELDACPLNDGLGIYVKWSLGGYAHSAHQNVFFRSDNTSGK